MSRLPRQISLEIVKFVFICTILGSFLSWTPNYYNSLLISRNDKNSQQFWMLSHQTAANFYLSKAEKVYHFFRGDLHACGVLKSVVCIFYGNEFDKIIVGKAPHGFYRDYLILRAVKD